MTRLTFVASLFSVALAAQPADLASDTTTGLLPFSGACLAGGPGVAWDRHDDPAQRRVLDQWCDSVGAPVLVEAQPEPATINSLVVISWNVHVGGGRVEELLEALGERAARESPGSGTVLLLQETFRSGADVPVSYPAGLRVPRAIRPRRPTPDVVSLARRLGMFAAYVPSMRNGEGGDADEREDRGNAIISTEPLSDVRAIELPFGRQRRVAVMATVTPRGPSPQPLRVVSMHLDTDHHRTEQARALATRLRTLKDEGTPLIAGGDLNSLSGFSDDAFTAVSGVMSAEPCGTERTNVWPLRLDVPLGGWLGRVDFIFSTLGSPALGSSCETLSGLFGSDHRPVVLVIPTGRG